MNQDGSYPLSPNGGRSGQHSGTSLPGSLQAGRPNHPSSGGGNVPMLSPMIPDIPQQSTPPRGSLPQQQQAHGYSRSSPASAMDDPSKLSATPGTRYAAQTPQSGAYSPLGLADIRPMASSGHGDEPPTPSVNPQFQTEPTNCNYLAPWPAYAFDWCKWPAHKQGGQDSAGKMAVGSYLEDSHNYIQVLDTRIVPDDMDGDRAGPQYGIEYSKTAEAAHSYPVTRILWEPETSQKNVCDLLATSGDHLRLWKLPSQSFGNKGNSITGNQQQSSVPKLTPLALLSNSKSPEHTAPLTSLDWNTLSPSLIITSSIDTTCTIWDIPSLTAKTQLIAHDKEVFDVRFCAKSVDVFVSCGADGSVRMFDLRSLEHSTIIYEPSEKDSSSPGDMSPTKAQQMMSNAPPLLRIAASPFDAHHLATFAQDSNVIRILDVRQPGQAILELSGHRAPVNCVEWSPSRRGLLSSGGDDSLVLVWNLLDQQYSSPGIGGGAGGHPNGSQMGGAGGAAGGAAGGQGAGGGASESFRSPIACWQCDYEVNNLSWAPQSGLTGSSGDWIGITAGRGIWGVSM